jgi:AraC-like DNA-binding protein
MKKQALDDLQHAVDNKKGQYSNFLSNPFIEPIRNSEIYKSIVQNNFHSSHLPDRDQDTNTSNEGLNPLDTVASPARVLMDENEILAATNRLGQLMDNDLRFLDTSLSLRKLADEVEIHPNKLSWLLNDVFGMSFSEYVNTHRLEVFKKKAVDPENKNLTLLGLAFESGFNSKSTFNDFFKKKTGMSPGKWLKQQ